MITLKAFITHYIAAAVGALLGFAAAALLASSGDDYPDDLGGQCAGSEWILLFVGFDVEKADGDVPDGQLPDGPSR